MIDDDLQVYSQGAEKQARTGKSLLLNDWWW